MHTQFEIRSKSLYYNRSLLHTHLYMYHRRITNTMFYICSDPWVAVIYSLNFFLFANCLCYLYHLFVLNVN